MAPSTASGPGRPGPPPLRRRPPMPPTTRAKKATARPARPAPSKHSVSYQLRELIEARGLTAYGVGRLADVDPGVISRFLRNERTITLDTLDQIAEAMGLRLVEVAARGRGRPRKAGPLSAEPETAADHSSPLQSTGDRSGVE